jgi:hypothetical protein
MKTRWPIRSYLSRKSCIMVILSFFLTLCPLHSAWTQHSSPLSADLATIKNLKTRAKEFARLLQKEHKEKKISNDKLKTGQHLYINAQGAVDGWVTQLQNDIREGHSGQTDKAKNLLQTAVAKSEEFTDYAEEQLYGKSKAGLQAAAAIATIISTLTTAVLNILGEINDKSKQQRQAVIEELENLRWGSFDDLSKGEGSTKTATH